MHHWEARKRNRSFMTRLSLLAFLALAGLGLYFYWPYLSFYFQGKTLIRLEAHARELETRLLSSSEAPQDFLSALREPLRLAELSRNNSPTEPLVYYYRALFDFYELMLRLPLDQGSLMELSGRGFLPRQSHFLQLEPIATQRLAEKIAVNMRKALALAPSFSYAAQANLIQAYATLLFTERTDLRELSRLQSSRKAELSPLLMKCRDWLSLVFYAQLGKKKLLSSLVFELLRNQEKTGEKTIENASPDTKDAYRLELSAPIAYLILSYGFYRAQDHIRALKFARRARALAEASRHVQVEALRMEAEIFYIQRGKLAAQGYFERAYALSGHEDDFVKARLNELYLK